MSVERKPGAHFARISQLYRQLELYVKCEGLKTKTFSDGGKFVISRIQSSAQNAYFINLGNFRCYMSEAGLEWVTLPSAEVELGDHKFVLAPRIMEDVKGNKEKAAGDVIEWIEECIKYNEIRPLATVELL